jgi:hypothetical protein
MSVQNNSFYYKQRAKIGKYLAEAQKTDKINSNNVPI